MECKHRNVIKKEFFVTEGELFIKCNCKNCGKESFYKVSMMDMFIEVETTYGDPNGCVSVGMEGDLISQKDYDKHIYVQRF